jgi:hypothetical protein
MTNHCPEETDLVTSDNTDLDIWNRSHTANEGIRYKQESVKQVYFGRLMRIFTLGFFDNTLVFKLCPLSVLR